MQQLFAVMTAVQISPEILLNQMRESSVYYHLVIDSDKCWANTDVSVMKKLPAKLSIIFPMIKLLCKSPARGGWRRDRVHINSHCRCPAEAREEALGPVIWTGKAEPLHTVGGIP